MNLSEFTLEQLLDEAEKRINCSKAKYKGIVIIGPPGSGKETQALKIKELFCTCYLSRKEMLKKSSKINSALGKQVKHLMDKGKLISDELLTNIIDDALKDSECKHGFILNGFPQTLNQAKLLEKILVKQKKKINDVVLLKVSDVRSEERSNRRKIHKSCETDVINKEVLIQQKDANIDTLNIRLVNYQNQINFLINFYQEKGLLRSIDGNSNFSNVWQRIKASLN